MKGLPCPLPQFGVLSSFWRPRSTSRCNGSDPLSRRLCWGSVIACGPGMLELTRTPDSGGHKPCLAGGQAGRLPGAVAMTLLSQPLEEQGLCLQSAPATLASGLTRPVHRTGYARLD